MFRFGLPLLLLLLLLLPAVAFADAKKPTYDEDVLPILKQHCVTCHGNDKQKSGLNLATFAALKAGGSSGEVIQPGNAGKSRLYTLTAHTEEPKMPPSGQKIPDAQIKILEEWIVQGARENSGSKSTMPEKPKVDIGLASVGKGKPQGPPPMPKPGVLNGDPLTKARRPGAVLAMAASPWAPLLAIGGQKQILLYNSDTGEFLGALPFEQGQINSLKFSRNSKFLLAAGGRGGASGKAVLFEVETGKKITEVGIETDALLSADISADQKLIAVGSPSKLVRIYNTADGTVASEIKKHTDWVTAVEFSPDGVLLATGDRNGGLFVWESATGREFHSLRNHTAMITDLSWRGDSNVLASSSEDTTVKLWEMENGGNIKNWAAHPGGAAAVKYSHDGRLSSIGRDKIAKVWNGDGGLLKQFEPFADLGLKVAFNHDDTKVIGGDWTGAINTWQVVDAKRIAQNDTNPLPKAERLKLAEGTFAAADAKRKAAEAAFNDSNTKNAAAQAAFNSANANVVKLTNDLAVAQKAVSDTTTAANAAKAAVVLAKAEVDKHTAAAPTLAMIEQAKFIAANAYAKASAEILDAAGKNPTNPMIGEQSKKAADFVKAAQGEAEAAKKANADNLIALKSANDILAALNKAVVDTAAAQAEAAKKVPLIQAELPKAQAAVAPLKTAADQAAAAVAPLKVALDAATAEFNAAKEKFDRLKPPPAPAPVAVVPAPAPAVPAPATVATPAPVVTPPKK